MNNIKVSSTAARCTIVVVAAEFLDRPLEKVTYILYQHLSGQHSGPANCGFMSPRQDISTRCSWCWFETTSTPSVAASKGERPQAAWPADGRRRLGRARGQGLQRRCGLHGLVGCHTCLILCSRLDPAEGNHLAERQQAHPVVVRRGHAREQSQLLFNHGFSGPQQKRWMKQCLLVTLLPAYPPTHIAKCRTCV